MTYDIEPIAAEIIKKEIFYLDKYQEKQRYLGSSYILITREEYDNVRKQNSDLH